LSLIERGAIGNGSDRDARPLARETKRHRPTDPSARACHNRDLTLEPIHRCFLTRTIQFCND